MTLQLTGGHTIFLRIPGLRSTGIVGNLTLTKTGTTARTATFPDRGITVAGVSGTLTTSRLSKFNASGDLIQSGVSESVTGGVLDFGGTLTAGRAVTFPDASIEVQGTHEVQSSNWQARNHGLYTAIASATVTDPSTPAAGHEFTTLVRNGTATVGGTAYATAGAVIRRVYHSGSWTNYQYPHVDGAWTWTAAQTFNSAIFDGGGGGLRRSIDTGYLALSGSTVIDATAARMEILGKSHATSANKVSVWGATKEWGTVAGVAQMTLDASGNLGIGVTPTAGNGLLQLASGTSKANGIAFGTDTGFWRASAGTVVFDALGTANNPAISLRRTSGASLDIFATTGSGYVGTATNHGLILRTNNTDRVVISAAGRTSLELATDPTAVPTYAQAYLHLGTAANATSGGYRGITAGYVSGATNTPVAFGYQQTSPSGFTQGDFFVATRDVTTDTLPTVRLRVKAAGQTRFMPLSADPAGAETGDVYYNSTTNKLRVYNGAWVDLH